ncbi:MAG: hypothetical protein B6U76_06245 [Desulfurococcales archaeon ex4484_217_2]|nr:MAG: hypothetical protein B6U76_06245 [Desulfurococcales archaeon ex4484_217_2]
MCIPRKLRELWIHIEFWSLLPHILVRMLLRKLCRFLICDRGALDAIVWIITTLRYPSFVHSVYGRFLFRLAMKEKPVYLYTDLDALARRADVPKEFLAREFAVYSVLARYASHCSINTGVGSPLDSLGGVLKCLKSQNR